MIYLAGPYTAYKEDGELDHYVQDLRHEVYCEIAVELGSRGFWIYTPVPHGHVWEKVSNRFLDYNYWIMHGLYMLEKACDSMIMCEIPGARKSKGLEMEIAHCELYEKQILLLPWDDVPFEQTTKKFKGENRFLVFDDEDNLSIKSILEKNNPELLKKIEELEGQ